MKILSSAIILLSVAVCSCTTAAPKPEAQLCFDGALQPIDSTSVFHDDRYYTWGSSPIKGEDGKYHILYARWGKEYGFLAWLTHSEVAHAVSDNPTGPFKFSDLALGVTDPARWDGYNIHNPTIKKFGDTYYLYYTGNTGDGKVNKTGFNWSHRNNQRIGVAVSKSLYGPWQQFDKPLIDVSEDPEAHDALMVANPSVTQMKDGKYLMIYKAVAKKKPLPGGGPVCHLYAISDSPTGPFKKYNTPIFTATGSDFPAEDPYIWLQGDTYYAIVKDMHGSFTKKGQSLALFVSDNGVDWKSADNPLVSTLHIKWKDGTVTDVAHLERPQVLFEDGKPSVLFLGTDRMEDYKKDGVSSNVHIPIRFK